MVGAGMNRRHRIHHHLPEFRQQFSRRQFRCVVGHTAAIQCCQPRNEHGNARPLRPSIGDIGFHVADLEPHRTQIALQAHWAKFEWGEGGESGPSRAEAAHIVVIVAYEFGEHRLLGRVEGRSEFVDLGCESDYCLFGFHDSQTVRLGIRYTSAFDPTLTYDSSTLKTAALTRQCPTVKAGHHASRFNAINSRWAARTVTRSSLRQL